MTARNTSNNTDAQNNNPQNTNAAGGPPPGSGVVDRRLGLDRRDTGDQLSGLERRRGPGRRLSDFQRAADSGEMTKEQFLFLSAIDAFKKANDKTFPTWTDVLEVVRLLGYRKTAASELNLPNAEDWREQANAPAGVRPDGWERRFRVSDDDEADTTSDEAFDELLPGEEAA